VRQLLFVLLKKGHRNNLTVLFAGFVRKNLSKLYLYLDSSLGLHLSERPDQEFFCAGNAVLGLDSHNITLFPLQWNSLRVVQCHGTVGMTLCRR
jgi:hypothetical protein